MGLFSVLDDIQGDVSNIQVASEALSTNDDAKPVFEIYAKPLDKQVLDKFNTLCWLTATKRAIDPIDKVGLSLAQEVFTMIPDPHPADVAKMTSQPSAGNKLILTEIIDSMDLVVPNEIKVAIQNLADLYQDNKDYMNQAAAALNTACTTINNNLARFKDSPPIVVDIKNKGSAYNLLTTDIWLLSTSYNLFTGYEKYTNVLSDKYKSIADIIKEQAVPLGVATKSNELSDSITIDSLSADINSLYYNVTSKVSSLNDLVGLTSKLTDADLVNDCGIGERLNEALADMVLIKKVYTVITTEGNFIENVASLLEFLD